MRLFIFFSFLLAFSSCGTPSGSRTEGIQLDSSQWNNLHEQFKESAIIHRRFKHVTVDSLLQQHAQSSIYKLDEIGKSVEGRAIYELTYGQGAKKVMLWSQMHGDEPTATMALFDIFNFLKGSGDGFDSIRNILKEELAIHVIPMLNPDGAERYMRRNAQRIDLNRDARAGQTVEGALLRSRAKAIAPRYGFNLHDQHIYYNTAGSTKPVSISLLAPAFNQERDVNEVREGAMKIIVGMNKVLNQYIPGAIARYDDTYTPRGFGDNFQSWGASTVLIESGGMKGDPEKQQIRKLNFIIILNALLEIAQGSYQQYEAKQYEDIPYNTSQLHDLVLRGLSFGSDAIPLNSDIAIRRSENTVGTDFFVRGRVEDIGDLQESFGYEELDAKGLTFVMGKMAEKPIDSLNALTAAIAYELLKKGIMGIAVKSPKLEDAGKLHNLPIHITAKNSFASTPFIDLGGTTNFYLADAAGTLKYAVLNGYLIDLSKPLEELPLIKSQVF